MTDTTTDPFFTAPLRTAGALPSSRTEDMTDTALAGDDIDAVKAELAHVRSHYQSLEFAIARAANQVDELERALRDMGLAVDRPTLDAMLRVFAGPVLEGAYETAHQVGFFLGMGMTVGDGLRLLYADLDHSDPERELSDADLQALVTPEPARFEAAPDGTVTDLRDEAELADWERELLESNEEDGE